MWPAWGVWPLGTFAWCVRSAQTAPFMTRSLRAALTSRITPHSPHSRSRPVTVQDMSLPKKNVLPALGSLPLSSPTAVCTAVSLSTLFCAERKSVPLLQAQVQVMSKTSRYCISNPRMPLRVQRDSPYL